MQKHTSEHLHIISVEPWRIIRSSFPRSFSLMHRPGLLGASWGYNLSSLCATPLNGSRLRVDERTIFSRTKWVQRTLGDPGGMAGNKSHRLARGSFLFSLHLFTSASLNILVRVHFRLNSRPFQCTTPAPEYAVRWESGGEPALIPFDALSPWLVPLWSCAIRS